MTVDENLPLQLANLFYFLFSNAVSMHGSLIVGIEHRLNQIEDKLSDVDARASEEADCNSNDRDLDRFIFSGKYIFNEASTNYFRS